jgi:hypothetical protein
MSSSHTLTARPSAAWVRRFARTTPGVIGATAVGLAAFFVAVGAVCAIQLDDRVDDHRSLLNRSEPFAYAAQNLYAALSAADASAASAFLTGIDTPAVRSRYEQALADAASAVTDVSSGATDPATRGAVADITAQMTAYAGLVESARSNNRLGYPVGSAYLREASSLMQTTTLPGAERIFVGDLATVEKDQRAVGAAPILGFALLAFAVAAICVGSVILSARTNRRFNVGLIVSTAAVVLVGGWVVVATGWASNSIEQSRIKAGAFENFAKARILAQQARTDETLQLIARGDITASEKSFNDRIQAMTALMGTAPSAAADGVKAWSASHRKQVDAYEGGDYDAAVAQAVGTDPSASQAQFAIVEAGLRDEIEQSRAAMRDHVSTAGTWLAWTPVGTLVLMAVAAAAAVAGSWPRLKEFL